MKKIIFGAMLLTIAIVTFSQQTKSSPALTKQDYLQKSNNQKTAAWLCLGGGTGLVLTGMAVAPKDYNPWYDVNTPKEDRQYHFAEALALTGFSSMLTSIPLFIASHRNKKKAMRLLFRNETALQLQNGGFINRHVPCLALKISL